MTRIERNRDAVLAAVRQTIMPDIEDVAATADLTEITARKYLAELLDEGKVVRERADHFTKGRGRWLYRIAEPGL